MTGTAGEVPIDIGPPRPRDRHPVRALRAGAAWAHLGLAVAISLAVCVQVYLIGSYVFGAGQGALDAHRSLGFGVHGGELTLVVLALVAWLPRTDVALTVLLAVAGTAQVALASGHGWVGGLHPLGALLVLVLPGVLSHRALARRRRRAA
jgi:hypothetical protein